MRFLVKLGRIKKRFFLLLLLLPLVASAAAPPTLTVSPILYWKFDDGSGTTALDSSGNGYTGTLLGSPLPQWTAGAYGDALDFGGGNYVISPNGSWGFTTSGTISLWVNPTASGGSIATFEKSNWPGWELDQNGFSYSGGSYYLNQGAGLGRNDTGCSFGSSVVSNQWNLLTVVVDRNAGLYECYANGVLQSSGAITQPALSDSNSICIGNRCPTMGGSAPFTGIVDEVRYYNQALTAGQVSQLYFPSCSVTLSPNPSPYLYTGTPVTLTWSSVDADEVYINNVGWVSSSGSTQVASQATTNYSCEGYNSSTNVTGPWTSASLTVTPPALPAAAITASSTSIYTGQSINITADFQAGTPTTTVSTFASVGSSPVALAFDSSGNLYSANFYGNSISEITPSGSVSTFATVNIQPNVLVFDSSGNLYVFSLSGQNAVITKFTPSGSGSTFASFPYCGGDALIFDSSGNLYVPCDNNSGQNYVDKITPSGSVSRFSTLPTGSAPANFAFDSSGNLYTANRGTGTVSKITPSGTASIFATLGGQPVALAFDSSGNLYVTNFSTSGGIFKVTPSGVVSTFASGLNEPYAIKLDSEGNLYVANMGNDGSNGSVIEITPGGTITTLDPNLSVPEAILFDSSGNLYVAVTGSSIISKITTFLGNDALTQDNIDEPYGTGIGASTTPDVSKTVTFSPTSPGTYTFYGLATTDYYPSWATYASTTVTVAAGPSCSLSLSPSTVSSRQTSTLSYSSSNATSFSISGIGSKTADATGSVSVSPSQTTTYTGTASVGHTVQNTCSATLTFACTPAYTCSGQTIQYTNSSCQVSNVTSCVSPAFCQAGSSSCLYPAIIFNQSGSYTGNLQLVPNLLQSGETTAVHWSVSNAQSCTVTGTNGDSWSGLSSPTKGETSKPITSQTIYTLACTAYGSNPNVSETATVNVTPVYEEK